MTCDHDILDDPIVVPWEGWGEASEVVMRASSWSVVPCSSSVGRGWAGAATGGGVVWDRGPDTWDATLAGHRSVLW